MHGCGSWLYTLTEMNVLRLSFAYLPITATSKLPGQLMLLVITLEI